MLVGIVDAKMVGGIKEEAAGYSGTEAQAAIAQANGFYAMLMVLGIGISYGLTPLVAAADAGGDFRRKTEGLKNAFLINFIANLGIFLALYFASPLMYHFGQNAKVVSLAIPFLNVMMFSLVPMSVFYTLKQFTEGLSLTMMAMFVTLGGNGLNILLNYVLIYGHWGFSPMGLQGACWASFISRVAMTAGMLAYVRCHPRFTVYWQEWKTVRLSRAISRKIVETGFATGLQWVFEVGAFNIAVLMIGWISVEAQAAHQVALSIAALTYMFISGISAATSVRVGNQVGLKDRQEIRRSAFSGFHLSMAFMGLSSITLVFSRGYISHAFSTNPAVIPIASSLLLVAALFQLVDGLQAVALGALRGVNDTRIPTTLTLIAYWVIALPACYLLAFTAGLGPDGIWYGLSIGLFSSAVMLLARFNWVSKRMELT
jgi:MATE family multidrug resistance protein